MTDETALAEAYRRGLDAEKAGRAAEAAAAYRDALALDPEDRVGAAVRLAALGAAPAPGKAPPAYVATLFDQTAEVFDLTLVDQLGYHAPLDLREALREMGRTAFGSMCDLGCGTGLSGESLEDMTERRIGVDLSAGMLEIADEKEVYDALFVGDAEGFLDSAAERFDLIVATDVLPYLGVVDGLFSAVSAALAPGGLFAFTTETATPKAFADAGWIMGPKHRYAHDPAHIDAALAAAGLCAIRRDAIIVRYDEGAPVPGHLIVAEARQAAA